MSVRKRKLSSLKPRLRKMNQWRSLRISIFIFVVGFLFLFSDTSYTSMSVPTSENAQMLQETPPALADNLYTTYTAAYVSYIATGTVDGQRGFAYVSNDDDALYLVNPINGVTQGFPLPSTGTTLEHTLCAVDIDYDSETEFLVGHDNTTHILLLLVDYNDGSLDTYVLNILAMDQLIVADINGDTSYEFAAVDKRLSQTIQFYDPDTHNSWTYSPGKNIDYVDKGRFVSVTRDSFAVAMNNNISIVQGNGFQVDSTTRGNVIYGVKAFNSTATVYDDIMISEGSGIATCLRADTLTQHFATSLVASTNRDLSFDTGNFTGDSQEDIVAVSVEHDVVWFLNGTDGGLIGVNYDQLSGDYLYDVGKIDSDELDDLAIRKWLGQPTFVHGDGFTTGYVEEEASTTGNIYLYDLNNDGRSDIIAAAGWQVYSILSDTEIPDLTLEPLDPLHPTALDDYITVEVDVFEESTIESARVYIRQVGDVDYSTQIDMMPNAPKVKYYAFITGLDPGFYEYYIHFVDTYRNEAFNGTPISPNEFEIIGNTAWEVVKSDISLGRSVHILDEGNTSSGETVLYTANWNQTGQLVQIDQHALSGDLLNSTSVSVSAGEVYDYGLYTGAFVGDSTQDIMLIVSNMTGTTCYIFHGNNLSLYFSSTEPISITALEAMSIVDDDGDGIEELHIMDNPNLRLCRMEDDGTWSNNPFAIPLMADSGAVAQTANDDTWQILLVTNTTRLDFYDAANLTVVRTAELYFDPSYTEIDLLSTFEYENATLGHTQFGIQYTLWNASGPTSRFYFFDVFTPNFNTTNMDYFGLHVKNVITYDQNDDGVDEMFIVTFDGQLIAVSVEGGISVHWSMPIGTGELIGHVLCDFDGNGWEDLVLFTHQDQKLRSVDVRGFISREINLAEIVLNPIAIGNIDPGLGEEIAAYPIIKDWTEYKIGVYRDLDWYTRMNITSQINAGTIIQGDPLIANITVENIFSESLGDATVTMTVSYSIGGEVAHQTSALLYSTQESQYIFNVFANYPMGVLNLTLDVIHEDYQSVFAYDVGQVTILSPLILSVHQDESVIQGENKTVYVTVTDSNGLIIPDAIVRVTIDGTLYIASFIDPDYQVYIDIVAWKPENYIVNVTASHPYATEATTIEDDFRVIVDTLSISNNIPTQIDQNGLLQGWLNITDSYTNPITGAQVKIESGETEYSLTEVEPGNYYLDELAALSIGNYTFTIRVKSTFISGDEFGNFSTVVTGNLAPSVEYPPEVDAGTNFTVSIFIYDTYGSTPEGATATVEFSGSNYTAIHIGGPEYSIELNASTAIGLNSFIVYINSTYGNDWTDIFDFHVYSDVTITLSSDNGWNLIQGSTTTLRVNLSDWSGTLVPAGSVNLLNPSSLAFIDHGNGTYTVDFSTTSFGPGNYSIIVSASHQYLYSDQTTSFMYLQGEIEVEMDYPTSIYNHQSNAFNFTVVDQYGNPISAFNYSITLGPTTDSAESFSHQFTWSTVPNVEPGTHWLNITISGEYLITITHNFTIDIEGIAEVTTILPSSMEIVSQGDDVNFTIHVQDQLGTNIIDADVIVEIKGNSYSLEYRHTGIYSSLITTTGLSLDTYNATIRVYHDYMDTNTTYRAFVLHGVAIVSVTTTPNSPQNHDDLSFNITLTDQYGNPVNIANYTLSFNGQSTSGTTSYYKFDWTITPSNPPGSYSLNVSLSGGYLIAENYTYDITLVGDISSSIISPTVNEIWDQGASVNFTVDVQDLIGSNILGAQVTVSVYGNSYTMGYVSDGIYHIDVSTLGYPLGTYNASISITHPYMDSATTSVLFILKGDALVNLDYSPEPLYNHLNSTFNFTVRDTYGNPVNSFNYSIIFGVLYSTSDTSSNYEFSWETETEFLPSQQWLNITLNATYLFTTQYNFSLAINGIPAHSLISPIVSEIVDQGDDVNFTISLQDQLSNYVSDATVNVEIAGSSYTLPMTSAGIYSDLISTAGFALGNYSASISISHSYLEAVDDTTFILVKGSASVSLSTNPTTIYNHQDVNFTITVLDYYGNPINVYNYTMDFAGVQTTSGLSTSYQVVWEITPNVAPGLHWLNVSLNSTYVYAATYNFSNPILGSSSILIIQPVDYSSHNQGEDVNFTLSLEDLIGSSISGAQVRVLLAGSTYTLSEVGEGVYSLNISTIGLKLDQYLVNITVTYGYLDTGHTTLTFNLVGTPLLSVSMNPSPVSNKENVTFSMDLTDIYGNPINNFNYSLTIESYSESGTASWYEFSWEINPNWIPGEYYLIVNVNSTYTIDTEFNVTIAVQGTSSASILSPVSGFNYDQGEEINFTIHVTDELFYNITGADVTVVLYGSSFVLNMSTPGIYTGNISTIGLPLGSYTAAITVSETFLGTEHLTVDLSLQGPASITYSQDNEFILNDEDTTFTFFIRDQYGNPLKNYNYSITLGELYTDQGTSSSYSFDWLVNPETVPGDYLLNISVSSNYIKESNFTWTIKVYGVQSAYYQTPTYAESITQGDQITLSIILQDLNFNNITSASIVVTIGSTSYSLSEVADGIYNRTITTTHLSLGQYTAIASIQHDYLQTSKIYRNFTIVGYGKPSVVIDEQPVYVGNNTTFSISMYDDYTFGIPHYNWSVSFQGAIYSGSTSSDQISFNVTIPIVGPPDRYSLIINIENPYITVHSFSHSIVVRSEASGVIHQPLTADSFLQASDDIPFVISVYDIENNTIPDASVRVQIHDSVFELQSYENGTYHISIPTTGWRYYAYPFFVYISHQYMDLIELNSTVNVIADPVITIHTSSNTAVQMSEFIIDVEVNDLYGTPLEDMEIEVNFIGENKTAVEIESGLYRAIFDNITVYHGSYDIMVCVSGAMCTDGMSEPSSVEVQVPTPDLDAIMQQDMDTWLLLVGIVLIISLAGMGIYFRIASSISIESRTSEDAERGTRRLDITYGVILITALLIFVHSLILGNSGEYAFAVAESILLLGLSVLLYGLWLYRDSYSAILQKGTLSRGRIVAGIWHLALVPVMIFQIISYGEQWEVFKALVLEPNVINLGFATLPMMILTIFGTYISSIVVVVINHYRETSKGLQRITHMQAESTPTKIVHEERSLLVEKTSSSIRTKFLMFLLIIGATTVSTLDFVRSANLAIIILLPVVFLVIIPFISSRMIRFLTKFRGRTKRGEVFTP